MERAALKHTHCHMQISWLLGSCRVTQGAGSGLRDDLEEWDGGAGKEARGGGTDVYLKLIHLVQQKQMQR